MHDPHEIHQFWFGELDNEGFATEETAARWWTKSPEFDEEVRERYAGTLEAANRGEFIHWLDEPRSTLALILLCDQFTRNMFRGTARMFASDGLGLTTSLKSLHYLDALSGHEKMFFVMPTMHSERLEVQTQCLDLFTRLHDAATGHAREVFEHNVNYAEKHRVIVERFGRFPHRNATLGRESTPEETAFLKEPGSSF